MDDAESGLTPLMDPTPERSPEFAHPHNPPKEMKRLVPTCVCDFADGSHWWSCPDRPGGQQEPFPEFGIVAPIGGRHG
jgi:hypothetical protein